MHIARLVATGVTSTEVGEQLFLSPRTIVARLRDIFRKPGIDARRQLEGCGSPELPAARRRSGRPGRPRALVVIR
ncbi:LuxR C-terminal-related transcriptional regulator [Geodermatophilus amargosae]|uniref:LuxR C-terminal-related transcriptional regulator n=1 Tax=Geodermatophilus amargosae TaxID=1296565 RepID=UPI0034DE61CC